MAPIEEEDVKVIYNTLGRIEEKLDTIPKRLDDHDRRISKVEFKMWVMWGVGALAILVIGAALSDVLSSLIRSGVS